MAHVQQLNLLIPDYSYWLCCKQGPLLHLLAVLHSQGNIALMWYINPQSRHNVQV